MCDRPPHLTMQWKMKTFDNDGYKTWFVARLMCIICQWSSHVFVILSVHSRSVYCFGMHDAVTNRLLVATARRSQIGLIDTLAGGPSLWAHHAYVNRLENVWAGEVVSVGGWGLLVASLVIEWSDSNLLVSDSVSVTVTDIDIAGNCYSIVSGNCYFKLSMFDNFWYSANVALAKSVLSNDEQFIIYLFSPW